MIVNDKGVPLESSTIPNFAKRHGLSLSTAYRLISDKELSVTKIRGLRRILREDEIVWLESVKAANKKTSKQSSTNKEDI